MAWGIFNMIFSAELGKELKLDPNDALAIKLYESV